MWKPYPDIRYPGFLLIYRQVHDIFGPFTLFRFIYIYMSSVAVKIVSRCFTETQVLTANKQQWEGKKKLPFKQ